MKAIFASLAIFAVCQSAVAGSRQIEGFTYLGPVRGGSSGYGINLAANYYLSDASATWTEGFAQCRAYGGRMATILNPVIDEDLRMYMLETKLGANAFIGLRRRGSDWVWESTNQKLVSRPAIPTGCSTTCAVPAWPAWKDSLGDCAHVTSSGQWGYGTTNCESLQRYICEF